MSQGASSDDASDSTLPEPARDAIRTVTPSYRGRPDTEMTAIGIAYFLGLLVLLVPLLPFVVLAWLASKLVGALGRRAPTEELPGVESE